MKKTNTGVRSTIFYSKICSPLGAIYIAFTEKGISRIELCSDSEGVFLKNLKNNYHRTIIRNDRGMTLFRKKLRAYFKCPSDGGKRGKNSFSFVFPIDILEGTPFEKKVWDKIKKIPFGSVMTYGEMALKIGNPKASRAVGMACKKNPLPILIPCHRVVGKDRSLRGYSSGIIMKRKLLEIEGVQDIRR